MPRLYLLRHGSAETGDDPPLCESGALDMQAEAKGLVKLGLAPDAILSSPLRRAGQTARIVAEAFGLVDRLEISMVLAPGCRLRDLGPLLRDRPAPDSVLLVGHQPDLGGIAAALLGAREPMALDKGAMLCLEISGWPPRPPATLHRAWSPSFLKDLGEASG